MKPLKQAYEQFFLMGTAIEPRSLTGERFEHVKAQYNTITAENCMKPIHVQAKPGVFTFEKGDALIKEAQANGMHIHGHTLVWHQQSPEWQTKDADRETAIKNMEDHIKAVLTHNKGLMISWDVVNEAFKDGDDIQGDPNDWRAALRPSPWLKAIGDDYIQIAFELAKKYDDKPVLYYNDYNLNNPKKRQAVYAMAKELREKGVPIEGIGMQGHYNLGTSLTEVEDSIKLFASLGTEISITELDVMVNEAQGQTSLDQTQEIYQAIRYAHLFELFKKYSQVIARVTLWGVDDPTSWRHFMFPLLFNGDYSPKLSAIAVADTAAFLEQHKNTEPYVAKAVKVAQSQHATIIPMTERPDPVWQKTTVIKANNYTTAWNGASAEVRTIWDPAYLYLQAEITTQNEVHPDTVVIELAGTTFNSEKAAVLKQDMGYLVEITLPWGQIGIIPHEGVLMRYNVTINDRDKNGEIQSIAKWVTTEVGQMEIKNLKFT